MLKKSVKEIMEANVISLPPKSPLSKAITLMADNNISFIVIASKENEPLGVITERDILKKAWDKKSDELYISDVMSSNVFSISADEDVMAAMHSLVNRNIRHLVVVDNEGGICGVLTLTDFLKKLGFEYFVDFKNIEELMDRSPLTLPADTDAFDALSSLSKLDKSCLIAIKKNRPAGIVTERDALRITQEGRDLSGIPLREIMINPVIDIKEGSCVFEALSVMNKNKIRHLPVINSCGELSGLVSQVDVARGMELKHTAFLKKIIEDQERNLKEANDRLEERISERTCELAKANERLQGEIEERKRTEEALRESEQKYKNVIENIGVGVSLISPNMEIMTLNRQMKEWFPHIDVTKSPKCYTAFNDPPREKECSYCPTNKTLLDGEVYESITETPAGDETLNYRIVSSPIKDKNDKVVAAIEVVEDITERKRAEEVLRDSEAKYRGIYNNAQVGIWRTRVSDGKMLECNKRLAHMFAYKDREDCINNFVTSEHYVDPDTRESWLAKINDKGVINNFETRLSRQDCAIIWVRFSGKLYAEKGYLEGVATDITEQKEAEESLRISKERYALAIEGANDGIWERNLVTGETHFSPRWKETIGYRDSELPNHVDEWKKRVHPDDYDMVIKNVDNYLVGITEHYISEYRMQHKDGSWRWILAKGAKVCDDQGNPTRLAGSHTDITERKRAEEERKSLEAQLLQAQKMETIGTLAGGIAHDFNNILSPILICAEIALDDTPEDSETHETIETILKAAHRAKDLVKRILLFSRSGEQNRETVKIKEAVNDALKLARSSIPTTITISKKIKLKDETITADPIQMHQLVMNLCTNAYQAMLGSGGEINIELSAIDINDSSNKLLRLKEGEYILLSISDTGHGIDESTKQRIFDPFFTTKDTGKGTGLGLSVVLGIVMNHDGEITVESEVGKGTTFHVYLPRSVQDDAAAMQSDEKTDPKGVENVLFVDDESAITFVGKSALEYLGYKVTAFNNATEALEMYRRKPDHFNIVISDYTMPNMTGLQLATELKNINRDIPVIIVSGYNDTINEENMDRFNIDEYIMKPFTGPQLGRAIRKVMDKK